MSFAPAVVLLGKNKGFLEAVEKIPLLAQSSAAVHISGETGVGKDVFACAIHAQSDRKNGPFVSVLCGALPEHLAENELFGHSGGAYTDAPLSAKGLIAEAEGGTFFLDEVDTLSAASQVKLLHFLETHEYRSLGSSKTCLANVRVISASNADLWKQVELGHFRSDLYYRLHILTISIPPLRERLDDVILLAQYFLEKYGRQYHHSFLSLDSTAITKMMGYAWPGNVRELAGVIERGVLMATTPVLHAENIDLHRRKTDLDDNTLNHEFKEAKHHAVAIFEQEYLTRLLLLHHGNISRAATEAGMPRQVFQRMLQKYHIDRKAYTDTPVPASSNTIPI